MGIVNPPVSIELIEKYIVERGFQRDGLNQNLQNKERNKTVAIVAQALQDLAAAQQLNRAGHTVTVFERDNKVGGLLRYGIPDFKMEKNVIDRRIEVLEAEGIIFKCNVEIGKQLHAELEKEFDAVVLATGATIKRELPIPGADLKVLSKPWNFYLTTIRLWTDNTNVKQNILLQIEMWL